MISSTVGGAVFAIDGVRRDVAVGRQIELRAGFRGGLRELVVEGVEKHAFQRRVFEVRVDEMARQCRALELAAFGHRSRAE